MATLEEVLKENDARGICIPEAALEAFYNSDPSYWATEDASDICQNAEDAWVGEFSSDEEFAQEMADDCGLMTDGAEWPYTCIDWEQAARELMYDYYKNDGCYFRNL